MKKHIRIGIIMVLVLCTNITIFAQREQTRKVTATGSYVASTNETPAYGQAQALLEAKKQALREAGVMENISSTAIIVMGSTGNEFQEISSELSRIELEGRVRVKEQSDAPPVFTHDNLVKYSTTIHAEVAVEEVEEDLNFRFKTESFKNSYLSGETMHFTLTPAMDCYVRIFFFGKNKYSNAQIYPIDGVFKDIRLKAGTPVNFPPEDKTFLYDQAFEYTMEIDNENENIEQDVVLIVALKKPYPFMEEVNYENVINWLSKIKRNERCVLWQGVNVIKN